MYQDKTTARPRPAWLPAEAGAPLEEAGAQEATREVVLGTRRTSGFYQSPTEKEGVEEGTVRVALARPRLPRGDQLTGPPEPLFLAPGREATRPRLPIPGPHVGEGELTTVRAFPREVAVIAQPAGLGRAAARDRWAMEDLAKTGPPAPMNRTAGPRSSDVAVGPAAVPTRATSRPPKRHRTPTPRRPHAHGTALPAPAALPLAARRPDPGPPAQRQPEKTQAPPRAADSISRICWNVLLAPPEQSPRGLLARVPWRKHRAHFAAALGALVAMVVLPLWLIVPGAQQGGQMEVISSPPGARVTVNGKQTRQTTPALIKVADVDHEQVIELSLADYHSWRKVVALSPGDPRVQVVAVLQADEGPMTESLASIP